MDSPWALAIGVFLLIYILFFFISLLADMFIVGIALGCAVLAYHIPSLYPDIAQLAGEWSLLKQLGLALPAQATASAHMTLAVLLALVGTVACIPFLPFSATYRQMLGANKISKGDELYMRRLVEEEWDTLRRRLVEDQNKRKAARQMPKPAPEPDPISVARRPVAEPATPRPAEISPSPPAAMLAAERGASS